MDIQEKALKKLQKETVLETTKVGQHSAKLTFKLVANCDDADDLISGKVYYSVYEDSTWLHSTMCAKEAKQMYNDVVGIIKGYGE
jgi:hypothetical protein